MTLQQLRYVTTVAETGTMSEAARRLFVSQPGLTKAIRELEQEMGIIIFDRTNKGIEVSKDGAIFLGYARQVLEQASLLEERYKLQAGGKKEFSVSTQHYSFAVNAFVDLIKEFGGDNYDFSLRETQTYEIIDDVASGKSELGLLYLSESNETVLSKLLRKSELVFEELFTAAPHVFINKNHPLADRKCITLDELKPYPYLIFEQGDRNSFYFSEELLSMLDMPKTIQVRDRATLFSLVIGLNGFTVSSGIIDRKLNSPSIIARPLEMEGSMRIGLIRKKNVVFSRYADSYVKALKKHLSID